MFTRSLKATIFLHLAVLLFTGMLLTDFIVATVVGRMLVRKQTEITRSAARSWAGSVSAEDFFAGTNAPPVVVPEESCVFWLENQRVFPLNGKMTHCRISAEEFNEIEKIGAVENGKVFFFGSSWGVFWKQPKYFAAIERIESGRGTNRSVVVVTNLGTVYKELRQSQKLVGGYIAINLFILVSIGLYRISKTTIGPIQKLVRRAEEFKDDEIAFFNTDASSNEFGRLSGALNRMLKRIHGDREKLRGAVASLQESNESLRAAQNEMIRTEKLAAVGRLSAGIAHEIGNPVGIVTGYLDLLKQANLTEAERHDFIGRSQDEMERIHRTIQQMLDFSRRPSGTDMITSIHALLEDVVAFFEKHPLLSNIDVRTCLNASLERVLCDPEQLRQVFVNLLINAADAIAESGRQDGHLIISTRTIDKKNKVDQRIGAYLSVSVSDNGNGVAPEHLDDLFEPFFTTKAPGKGTGLGLSVCLNIVESINGRIRVESERGKGTCVSMELPVVPDSRTPSLKHQITNDVQS